MYTLSFSIGDPAIPVTWTVIGLPDWLTLDPATGLLSNKLGRPVAADKGTYTFVVTATRGTLVVNQKVTILVS